MIIRQISITDDWTPNEVHVSRITDHTYGCMAKLRNGRLAAIVLPYKPDVSEEKKILRKLIWQDFKSRVLAFFK